MTDGEPQDSVPAQTEVRGGWVFDPGIPQAYVDEAALAYLNERVFLTLGQVVVTHPVAGTLSGTAQPPAIEIRPVARLVLTEGGFHRLLTMLNNIAGNIPRPRTDKTEE